MTYRATLSTSTSQRSNEDRLRVGPKSSGMRTSEVQTGEELLHTWFVEKIAHIDEFLHTVPGGSSSSETECGRLRRRKRGTSEKLKNVVNAAKQEVIVEKDRKMSETVSEGFVHSRPPIPYPQSTTSFSPGKEIVNINVFPLSELKSSIVDRSDSVKSPESGCNQELPSPVSTCESIASLLALSANVPPPDDYNPAEAANACLRILSPPNNGKQQRRFANSKAPLSNIDEDSDNLSAHNISLRDQKDDKSNFPNNSHSNRKKSAASAVDSATDTESLRNFKDILTTATGSQIKCIGIQSSSV